MTRWFPALTLGLLLTGTGALVARERGTPAARATAQATTSGAPGAEPAAPTAREIPVATRAEVPVADVSASAKMGSFDTLVDGSPVPTLEASAPQKVKLGVALFLYRGAQGSTQTSRSRKEAQTLAERALAEAGTDFASLVKRGDPGSGTDVGWVGRGVLERAVEYAVFTLPAGQTLLQPLDTPRGFWVVRRTK